jgi:hypothetical protein
MSAAAMIELLDESDISGTGTSAMVLSLPPHLPEEYFENLVAEKRAASTIITANGLSMFRVIWQWTANKCISVLLALAVAPPDKANFLCLCRGMDVLAAREKASAILFSTGRRALVTQTMTWGASPFQIWMRKDYAV